MWTSVRKEHTTAPGRVSMLSVHSVASSANWAAEAEVALVRVRVISATDTIWPHFSAKVIIYRHKL